VSSAGNAENLSVASKPLNNKEDKEDNQTISSCTPSESRSPTPFDMAHEHPEFLLQINIQVIIRIIFLDKCVNLSYFFMKVLHLSRLPLARQFKVQ
jgi:hypothetical protein